MILTAVALVFISGQAQAASAGAVTVNSGTLNVRRSASTASPVTASLKKGSYITLISKSGPWWQVEYAPGRLGYCHSNYVTQIAGTEARVKLTSGSLNVRTGAGTGYRVAGSLRNSETVVVLSSTGGWSRVLYDGVKTGYVSSRYLAEVGGVSAAKAISLSVPSYKQTDSRWANAEIGTSGKTISQIGCATTALAMMESYRTGSTIYPDEMAKNLTYTPTGSVYWPSQYTLCTDQEGHLSAIYEKLKSGQPVLFGGKNKYGGQHWVVITGYRGGDTLTPSGFTINDPGSSSRDDLQDFLDKYPTFYKYFW